MTLLQDPTLIKLDGEDVLLMHGDSLCTRDEAYMQFRTMARSPEWQKAFLSKTIEERVAFAQQARDESQSSNSMKDDDIMDVTPEEVDSILEQFNCQRLIHGHTHRPATHNWQHNGQDLERIVLGDWYTHGWYLKVQDGQYQQVKFELPKD